MTKVKCWSISLGRSYRPESDIKLLRFSLSGGYLIYIKKMYNQIPYTRMTPSHNKNVHNPIPVWSGME